MMTTDLSRRRLNGKLYHAMVASSRRRGGAHDTRERRERECQNFCAWLFKHNRQYVSPAQIRERDVRTYFTELVGRGLSLGTLQNRASYLRVVVPRFRASNQELGISGRSRHGKHEPCPMWLYESAAKGLADDWARALLMLQRCLGLRILEGIRSGPSIASWLRQLHRGDMVHVVFGTKGGRPRLTQVPDRGRALEAVIFAQRTLKGCKRRYLAPSKSQKAAKNLYYQRLHEVGIRGRYSSHSLRYAFACELLEMYARGGYSAEEAFSLVSQSLGHGDGRGRYIKAVYCRMMPPYEELSLQLRRREFERVQHAALPKHYPDYDADWSVMHGKPHFLEKFCRSSQPLLGG